jgi:glycosyltransferase involved in cell wall biosynthesis
MTVTIGLPFYNNQNTLKQAIQSVFAQDYQDWELILIDDGSKDNSLEIARSVLDPRVRVISDGTNKGLSARLNQIASIAEGRYLARMDADDIMHPERIKRQVYFLEKNPKVDIVGTGTYIIDKQSSVTGARGITSEKYDCYRIFKSSLFIHPTILGRTEWFRQNPYSTTHLRAEDKELWIRTYNSSNFHIMHEPLFFYRDGYSLQININNYLRTFDTEYDITRKYGPELIGALNTATLLMRVRVKRIAYIALHWMGKSDVLIKRRNTNLDPSAISAAQKELAQILNTKVPGLC